MNPRKTWNALVMVVAAACLGCEIDLILGRWHEIRLASRSVAAAGVKAAVPPVPARPAALRRPSVPDPRSFAARYRKALADPEFRRQLSAVQLRMIAGHYGALIDALKLDPADRERFTELLVQKQLVKTDAESAAYDNGLFGTGAVVPAITEAQKDVNAQIEQLLGPEGYEAYDNFEMTDGLRMTLQRLQSSLQYTPEAISDADLEKMVGVLDQSTPPDRRGGIAQSTGFTAEVAAGLVAQQFSSPLPADAADLLKSELSPDQLKALGALMEQQRNELALRSQALAAIHSATNPPN